MTRQELLDRLAPKWGVDGNLAVGGFDPCPKGTFWGCQGCGARGIAPVLSLHAPTGIGALCKACAFLLDVMEPEGAP